jgi:REP element-mobilizing transposase RayT
LRQGCRQELSLEGVRVPRASRYFVDGAVYHVYGRIARGERVFADDREAARLRKILQDVRRRDGWTIFAWCVVPTHYDVALRTSSVALWRSMRLVQWRFAHEHNRRRRQLGPVWQGRYQATMVDDERYLLQLIAHLHLNPVVGRLVEDAAAYQWSGHRELLGKSGDPLVAVDAALALFRKQRSQARRAYIRILQGERQQSWVVSGCTGCRGGAGRRRRSMARPGEGGYRPWRLMACGPGDRLRRQTTSLACVGSSASSGKRWRAGARLVTLRGRARGSTSKP